MATGADRFTMWCGFENVVGRNNPTETWVPMPDSFMDTMRNTMGYDEVILSTGWLFGGGSDWVGRPLTATERSNTTSRKLQTWEENTNGIARLLAKGFKVYLACYLSRWNTPAFIVPNWFDDTEWNTQMAKLQNLAAYARYKGCSGVLFDAEDYRGATAQPVEWDLLFNAGGNTVAATKAKLVERGQSLAQTIRNGFGGSPLPSMGAYFWYLPGSLRAEAYQNYNQGSLTDVGWGGHFSEDADCRASLMKGIMKNSAAIQEFTVGDAALYKDTAGFGWGEPGALSLEDTRGWDGAHQWGVQRTFEWCSQTVSGTSGITAVGAGYDPDKVNYEMFAWIGPGPSCPGWECPRSAAQVAAQLAAGERHSTGGRFWNYHYERWNNSFSYAPYTSAMQAASTPTQVDTTPPSLTISSSVVSGLTLNVSGNAKDAFAIRSIRWVNNTTGVSGVAPITWQRNAGNHSTGWPNSQCNFSVAIPLQSGPTNSVVVTAEDSHGLKTSATVLGTPGASGPPVVTVGAATGVGSNLATLNGTVNPNGAATDARFEYGTTTSYGSLTVITSMGSGTSPVSLASQVQGLDPQTTYHYRVTATNANGTIVSANGTFTTLTLGPPPGGGHTGSYAEAVAQAAASYWRLGESSGAVLDSSGLNTGSAVGGVSRGVPGIPGGAGDGAMNFNGTSGYVEVPHATSLDLGNGPLTMKAWVRRTSTGTTDVILDKGPGAYQMYIANTGFVTAARTDFTVTATSSLAVTDSNWHHIVVTYTGSVWRIYIDGVDRTGQTAAATLTNNTTPLRIGQKAGSTAAQYFAGDIDEVALYSSALSATEVSDLYAMGSTPEELGGTPGKVSEAELVRTVTASGGVPPPTVTVFSLRKDGGGSALRGGHGLRGVVAPATVVTPNKVTETETARVAVLSTGRRVSRVVDTELVRSLRRGQTVPVNRVTETEMVRDVVPPAPASVPSTNPPTFAKGTLRTTWVEGDVRVTVSGPVRTTIALED